MWSSLLFRSLLPRVRGGDAVLLGEAPLPDTLSSSTTDVLAQGMVPRLSAQCRRFGRCGMHQLQLHATLGGEHRRC